MDYQPFEPLIKQDQFSNYATTCVGVGFLAFIIFLIYETTYKRKDRNLGLELVLAFVASIFLGSGFVFVLLALGIYI